MPVARLAEALPIMADVALRPTFPPEELERLRQQRLTSLLQARDDPATIAALAFSRVLYGAAHRFGTATMGTAETIKAFTPRRSARVLRRRRSGPTNATLIVVGDVTPDKVAAAARGELRRLEARRAGGAARHAARADASRAARTVYLVDKPGAPQSQIRIGWVGVPRSTPDYFPLQVMNTILGGSFTLAAEPEPAREERLHLRRGSVFDMRVDGRARSRRTAGVQTDKTSEALKEFFNELNGILQPVPADELARAKNYVALRFPSGFETTGDISRRLEDVLVYKLPTTTSRSTSRTSRPSPPPTSSASPQIHPARPRRRRRRRRPEDDRAGHPGAQPGTDQGDDASTRSSENSVEVAVRHYTGGRLEGPTSHE